MHLDSEKDLDRCSSQQPEGSNRSHHPRRSAACTQQKTVTEILTAGPVKKKQAKESWAGAVRYVNSMSQNPKSREQEGITHSDKSQR